MKHHSVTFDLGVPECFSAAIFEIYLSYHKDTSIAATVDYMYFYLIVLSPLITVLNIFYNFISFSKLINAVNMLLNHFVLILCLYTHSLSL